MEKEFIPYQQALALKELGFDEPCFRWYDERFRDDLQQDKYNTNKDLFMTDLDCSAPLYQQAFRWFREKYNLHSVFENDSDNYYYVIQGANDIDFETIDSSEDGEIYQTYEGAELECLKKLIEIVKEKKL